MPTFNLSKWLEKQAHYEGAQGYFMAQTMAWMNCQNAKRRAGMDPQKAWQSCCDEFQKGDQKLDWVGKYAADLLPMAKQAAEIKSDKDFQDFINRKRKAEGRPPAYPEQAEGRDAPPDKGLKAEAQESLGQLQMGPYWDRIEKKVGAGKTYGQAVLETLQECSDDAKKIPLK